MIYKSKKTVNLHNLILQKWTKLKNNDTSIFVCFCKNQKTNSNLELDLK